MRVLLGKLASLIGLVSWTKTKVIPMILNLMIFVNFWHCFSQKVLIVITKSNRFPPQPR